MNWMRSPSNRNRHLALPLKIHLSKATVRKMETRSVLVKKYCKKKLFESELRGEAYQQTSDAEECYEDMIACSPASSEFDNDSSNGNGRNGKIKVGRRKEGLSETDELFQDEDISQYEFDSFRSMMAVGVAGAAAGPGVGVGVVGAGKPIDKASVRRYCTHEADNAYRCNVCGKTYTHISNFCRHFLSTHHGMRPEIPCPVCFKLFTRKDNMMTHTKQVHRLTLHRGTLQPLSEPGPDAFPLCLPPDSTPT